MNDDPDKNQRETLDPVVAGEPVTTMPGKEPVPSEHGEDGEVARQLKSWDIVAFMGLLTFVTTLAFEYGRATYWDFPTSFVRFSSENAFIVFVRLAIAAVFVGLVVQVARLWKWYRIIVSLLSTLLVLLAIPKVAQIWGGLAPLAIFISASYVITAVVVLMQSGAKRREDSPWLIRALGKGGVALSAAMVAIPYAAVVLGFVLASWQKDFIVTTHEPQRVLLAAYGSSGVFAVLSGNKETGYWITNEFFIHELSDDRLGPLKNVKLVHLRVGAP